MNPPAAAAVLPSLALESLPDDPALLKSMIAELVAALRASQNECAQVHSRLDQLLRRLYGPRAERFDPNQPVLFPETSPPAPPDSPPADPADTTTPTPQPSRQGHGRQRLPAHLRREQRLHELTVAERACPCCGEQRVPISTETSEQLDYVPASLFVIEHVRRTYACPRCQKPHGEAARPTALLPTPEVALPTAPPTTEPSGATPERSGPASTFSTAAKPAQPIERGLPGPGLLAQVIVSKFSDHLPLYRQEQIFARLGVPLRRSTLCDWLARCGQLLLPVYELLKGRVLQSWVIQTDDTPVPVQDDTRDGTRQGRVWVYRGDAHQPYLVYAYSPNREQEWPQQFLQGYQGFLQADGYTGYDGLYAQGKVVEVGCWAHARRKFFEAQGTDPERSVYVLGVIRRLYAVEKSAAQEAARQELSQEESWALRLRLRQEESVPLLTSLCQWLEEQREQVLPKSPVGEAITYALNQWQALQRYTTRGFLEIDNNAAERALRAIAVGRKNYLFFGSDVGGETAAVLYSLTQTCRALGVEPWRYMRDVLERLPNWPVERREELLPDRWAAAERARAEAVRGEGGEKPAGVPSG
jgi:transposase